MLNFMSRLSAVWTNDVPEVEGVHPVVQQRAVTFDLPAKDDFEQDLLGALQAVAGPQNGSADWLAHLDTNAQSSHHWGKLGLAIHRQVRHWCITDKTRLVHTAEDGKVGVFGGFYVTRGRNGALESNLRGADALEIRYLGLSLYREATKELRHVHFRRLTWLLRRQAAEQGIHGHKALVALEDLLSSAANWTFDQFKTSWWGKRGADKLMVGYINKCLWEAGVLDREVFGLCVQVFGLGRLQVGGYNDIAFHREGVKARIREASNLAPLLAQGTIAQAEDYSGQWHIFHDKEAFKELQQAFMDNGGTPAGWRWLTKQSSQLIRNYFQDLSRSESIALANACAVHQVGRIPGSHRMNLQMHLFSTWNRSRAESVTLSERYCVMLRLLSQVYGKRKIKVSALTEQLPLVWDYLQAMPKGESLHKATWVSLVRRQEEWHRAQVRIRRAQSRATNGCVSWAPLTADIQVKGFVATSLNDSDALWDEGDEMSHCVGGYQQPCFRNQSRIYSIRTAAGERVATMEVRLKDGKSWTLGQLYGPQNRSITDASVKTLAKKVVAACNRAPAPKLEENKVVRQVCQVKARPVTLFDPVEAPMAIPF